MESTEKNEQNKDIKNEKKRSTTWIKIEEAKEDIKEQGFIKLKTKLILTIIALCVIILILAIYSVYTTYAVYKKYYNSTLGDNLEFVINSKGNYVKSITYPTSILTTLSYNQNIDVRTENLTEEMYVRVKIVYTDYNNNIQDIDVEVTDKWVKGKDDYYYLNNTLTSNEIVTFSKKIKIEESNKEVVNSVLTVIVETLPVSIDIEPLWLTPTDFIS